MAVGRGWNDIKQKRGLCGTSFTLDQKAPAPRWRNHSFQITWPTQEFLQGTQSEWKMDSETGQYGDYRESCSLIGGNILLKSGHFLCYNQFKNQNLWRNVFLYLAGPFWIFVLCVFFVWNYWSSFSIFAKFCGKVFVCLGQNYVPAQTVRPHTNCARARPHARTCTRIHKNQRRNTEMCTHAHDAHGDVHKRTWYALKCAHT